MKMIELSLAFGDKHLFVSPSQIVAMHECVSYGKDSVLLMLTGGREFIVTDTIEDILVYIENAGKDLDQLDHYMTDVTIEP
jgi:hypothetical protein